jgi:hypothetical protein
MVPPACSRAMTRTNLFSAQRTVAGFNVRPRTSANAVSSFTAPGSGAMSTRNGSTIGLGQPTTARRGVFVIREVGVGVLVNGDLCLSYASPGSGSVDDLSRPWFSKEAVKRAGR